MTEDNNKEALEDIFRKEESWDNDITLIAIGHRVKYHRKLIYKALTRASVAEELAEALGDYHDALWKIKQWVEAYPEDIFIPVSSEEMEVANQLLADAGINMSAMHGQWARHIVDGIGNIVNEPLSRYNALKEKP